METAKAKKQRLIRLIHVGNTIIRTAGQLTTSSPSPIWRRRNYETTILPSSL